MDIWTISLHSINFMNQQLAEWFSVCPAIRVTRVRVLGTSSNSCRRLIFVISFISEKLGLIIYVLCNKYVLRMLRLLSRKTFISHPVPSSFKVSSIFLFSFFTDLLNVNVLYTLINLNTHLKPKSFGYLQCWAVTHYKSNALL